MSELTERLRSSDHGIYGPATEDAADEIERLERALKLQRNAALTLADASAAISGARLEQARKLFAESRPESVESERAMNAILTADVERLERDLAAARAEIDGPRNRCPQCDHLRLEIGEARAEVARLTTERDALAQDAERYRWLRSDPMRDGTAIVSVQLMDFNEDGPTDAYYAHALDSLDAAIDAMREGGT